MIGNVERVHLVLEYVDMVAHLLDVGAFWRADLAGHYELARVDGFPEALRHFLPPAHRILVMRGRGITWEFFIG
ncbi:hypothetical protein ES703_118248 [subsurface metagenome]